MVVTALVAVLLAAGLVLCGVTTLSWQRGGSPATDRFAVAAGVAGVGSASIGTAYLVESTALVFFFATALGLALPLPWAVFAFGYTGMDRLLSRPAVGTLAVPSAIGLLASGAVFLGDPSRIESLFGGGAAVAGTTVLSILQWFTLLYAGGLLLVGSGLVVWVFQRYDHLDSTTGAILGVFGTVPWLSLLFGLRASSLSMLALGAIVAVGMAVGAGSAVALAGPIPLFERVPAAGSVGSRTVVRELTDPVVVTDRDGRILETNRSLRHDLSVDPGAVLGDSVGDLLGKPIDELGADSRIEPERASGRQLYQPAVSELTDPRGEPLGHAVVLRDVTDDITRRQRLEVFNRILRHNVRNDMTIIKGEAKNVDARVDGEGVAESTHSIVETAEGLVELGEKAREVERLLEEPRDEPGEPFRLKPLVEDVAAETTAGRDGVIYEQEIPERIAVEARAELVRVALSNLLENAVEHNDAEDPMVRVEAEYDPGATYPLCVSVLDNGPGVPETETRTIESGTEEPLQHSDGIGLWIVRWATNRLRGRVSFDDRSPRGTEVSIYLPEAERR